MLGEQGGEESAELVVEDCFIYTALDTSAWTARDWVQTTASGVWLGRHGRAHVARNNYILNTRFGISLCAPDCLAEGNVVANFSADGIRVTRDRQTVHYNVIKNVFVNERDGDDNHDDGIQLGQKKNRAAGNTVRNNFAHTFDFKADAAVKAQNNQEVTEAVFNQRLAELAREIDRRFGEHHPTAKRPRLESTPARTSLSDPNIRFAPSPKPYFVLRCGPLTAVVVDNQAVDDAVLPGHRAGYNGLGALRHERQARSLFVPAYAGLNLEHILDGTPQERTVLFEPRNAPMELRVIDERTAELYQPPTLAMAWALSGERRYLDAARQWALASCGYPTWGLGRIDGLDLAAGHQLFGLATVYDWCQADLDEEARHTIHGTLVRRTSAMFEAAATGKAWWQDSYLQTRTWASCPCARTGQATNRSSCSSAAPSSGTR